MTEVGLRIHPRHAIVRHADIEIGEAIGQASEKHHLTVAEVISILTGELSRWSKYAIRYERHGTCDKKGDEA